jgi:hypothetical protein
MAIENEKMWTSDCVGRLRLVQADAAALTPEKRREFLKEEIARKLEGLPQQGRRRYLEGLLAQFPVNGQYGSNKSETQQPATVPAPKKLTFNELFQEFVDQAAQLPLEQKSEVVRLLGEAGLASQSPARASGSLPAESLKKVLLLTDHQQPIPERVDEVAAALTEIICKIEAASLASLRQVSPQNPLLRGESLKKILSQYVVNEKPAAGPGTRAFESLIGAIIQAIVYGGAEYGRRYLQVMSPDMIWEVAKSEAGMFGNKKELAWEKYKDLATEYGSSDQINRKVKEAMGAFIDTALGTGT